MAMQPADEPRAVELLRVDPELARAVPQAERATAARVVIVMECRLERGPWRPTDSSAGGLLQVLSGALLRDVSLGGRIASTVFGPGDLIEPWPATDSLVPGSVTWSAPVPTRLAVLSGRFLMAQRRWPGLAAVVRARRAEQEHRSAIHRAVCQLPRVEDRVWGILCLLADRWGRVTPEGVIVPLRLTHEALGRLIGAQRPTVSLALKTLQHEGSCTRRDDGAFVLDHARLRRVATSEELAAEPIIPLEPLDPFVSPLAGVAAATTVALDEDMRRQLTVLREDMHQVRARTGELVASCRATVAAAATLRANAMAARAARPRLSVGVAGADHQDDGT